MDLRVGQEPQQRGVANCSVSKWRPGSPQMHLRASYLLFSSCLLLVSILLWYLFWVWVSIIFGLVPCYCLVYIIKNCYMHFCMPRVISGPYLAERDSVCFVVVLIL